MMRWKRVGFTIATFAAWSGCACAAPVATQMKIPPPTDLVDVPSRFVLTGNAGADELSSEGAGATYSANPAFDNPPDPQNDRLIDNERNAGWNSTAGLNHKDQSLTFDLKQRRALDEAVLSLFHEHKPASITAFVADKAEGPWRQMSTMRLGEQKEAQWRLPLKGAAGRFVRFDFKLKDWGWYINEIKIYGPAPMTAGAVRRYRKELVLADETGSHAALVLADRPHANALEAATLFQKTAQRMTGVRLPIIPESKFNSKSGAIFIGDSKLARKNGVRVAQNPLGDSRYLLRSDKNWLALVGNDSRPNTEFGFGMKPFRGSVYAVYDFFERRGCGWYGTEALWQVIPRVERLTAPRLDVLEVPAFKMRNLWLAGLTDPSMRDALRQGGLYVESGHSYDVLVPPAKYKAAHPEWFGEGQPDITHPEVIRVAVEHLAARLDARPTEAIVTFSVSSNDTEGYKHAPFKPEVGNIAAQQLYFTNEIAKGLRQLRPERRFLLGMLGYWHSHDGPSPMLKGEPEVRIFVVNEGNHTKPLDIPETPEIARNTGRNNTREIRAMASWKQTGKWTGIYEWWIPVIANAAWREAPWYDGDTAIRNLRLWQREGVRDLTYEIQSETNGGFPLRWAQYYVAARGMWNPNINPRQVLLEANTKLYGPAATVMTSYYELQQSAMRATTEHAGNWGLSAPHLIYTPQIEAQGDAILAQAANVLAKLPADDPMRARVEVERKIWQRMKEMNGAVRTAAAAKTYSVTVDGKKMEFPQPKIDAATIRGLFGFADDLPLEVLEADGQNRAALAGESYDLQSGVTFRTVPKP